jgi:hypothetical protein
MNATFSAELNLIPSSARICRRYTTSVSRLPGLPESPMAVGIVAVVVAWKRPSLNSIEHCTDDSVRA